VVSTGYDARFDLQAERLPMRQIRPDRLTDHAGVLASHGIGRGDPVVIYLPMVPEAAIAMLTCARSGAIQSIVIAAFNRCRGSPLGVMVAGSIMRKPQF
jgi:propionyl-CoA synthetase